MISNQKRRNGLNQLVVEWGWLCLQTSSQAIVRFSFFQKIGVRIIMVSELNVISKYIFFSVYRDICVVTKYSVSRIDVFLAKWL